MDFSQKVMALSGGLSLFEKVCAKYWDNESAGVAEVKKIVIRFKELIPEILSIINPMLIDKVNLINELDQY